MKTKVHFLSYLAHFFLEWEICQNYRENQSTQFIIFISKKKCAIYEIMWENIVELSRQQMAIWHMHIACWIPIYKHTVRIC